MTAIMGAAPGAAVGIEDPRPGIDDELRRFLAGEREVLERVSPELGSVCDLADSYLDGGKRLRPSFCYWGWRATGAPATPQLVSAASALELLQACALIHDDVMDGSDTRRGRPSAHRHFASHHTAAGWRGHDATFGVGAAILLGDLFLTWSDQLFSSSGLSPAALERGRPLFNCMRTELMAGQYLDLVVQAQREPDRSTITTVLQYKSAKYTIEHPLQLGALIAGADDALVAGLGRFGLPLGEAFQLRDDLLGVFGDPAVTGKPAGDDLREGKQTLLIAEAFAAADPQQRSALEAGLGDPSLTESDVVRLRDVLRATGAVTVVEQQIADRAEAAMSQLSELDLPDPARSALFALADASVRRNR